MRLRNICVCIVLIVVCSFNVVVGQTEYYWVGGSGDWNDINHWSFTSGGAGGAGIPNNQIDALFDGSSFNIPGQVVTIGANAFCDDLLWTGVTNMPTFQGMDPNVSIDIGGSLRFSSDMFLDFRGPTNFTSTNMGNVIESAGQIFSGDIIFDGFGGEWTLTDGLDVSGLIDFRTGSLVSNDQMIVAISITALTAENVGIDLGNSIVRLLSPFGVTASFIMDGDNITLQAANAQIFFTGGDDGLLSLSGGSSYEFGPVSFSSADVGILSSESADLPPFFNTSVEFQGEGRISGSQTILNLILANNHTVFLENGSEQFLDDITVSGIDCEGDARLIYQNEGGPRAILNVSNSLYNGPIYLRGIELTLFGVSSTITIAGGFDGGNNSPNLLTSSSMFETLYWVGDGGDWGDANNWSMSSGGPGGACIPRSVDNVVFDENSFPSMNPSDMVRSQIPVVVNSFTFTTPSFGGSILMPSLSIVSDKEITNNDTGLVITSNVILNIDQISLFSADKPGGGPNNDNLFVDVIPGIINDLLIGGEVNSRVRLLSDLSIIGEIVLVGGVEFDTDELDVNTRSLSAVDQPVTIRADGSTITIRGMSTSNTDHPLTILNIASLMTDGETHWIFIDDNSGLTIDMGSLGDVTFSGIAGTSRMDVRQDVGINILTINNDGIFTGMSYDIDSLIFAPGHDYELGAGVDVALNSYFEGLGDMCSPITFHTSGNNIGEDIDLDNGIEMNLSTITITDIDAIGGGMYFAGAGSEGFRSQGWTFPTAAENEAAKHFLGEDVQACSDTTIILSPFDANDIMGVTWEVNGVDVTNTISYQIDPNAIEVIAKVITPSGCPIFDTIAVAFDPSFTIDLGMSRDVCQGGSEILDPGYNSPTATYLWNTGATTETIGVNTTDDYRITVTDGGCVESAQVVISRIDIEPFGDVFGTTDSLTLCEDDTRSFAAPNFTNATFTWNDGANTGPLEVSTATRPANGYYFIEVTEGTCVDRDSIFVDFDQSFTIDLGLPRDVCQGAAETLDPGYNTATAIYVWSNNETTETINVSATDDYIVTVTDGACEEISQVMITRIDLEPFDDVFGTIDSLTLCDNDTRSFAPPNFINASFTWNDGADSGPLEVSTTTRPSNGYYFIEVTEGMCTDRDSIFVDFEQAFAVDLGMDREVCQGTTETLDPQYDSSTATYRWSTSETTDTINVDQSDDYRVTVTDGACVDSSLVTITRIELEPFDLGNDTTLCALESFSIPDPNFNNATFVWNDGITSGPLSINVNTLPADSIYHIEVTEGICTDSDSIKVSFDPAITQVLTSSLDLFLCEGDSIDLQVVSGFDSVRWNTGSADTIIRVSEDLTYIAQAYRGTCSVTEERKVTVIEIEDFSLGGDVTVCETEDLSLPKPSNVTQSLMWIEGVSGDTISTMDTLDVDLISGVISQYILIVQEGDCTNSDTIEVTVEVAPILNITADTTICEGESVDLSVTSETGVVYDWSNGETTNLINVSTADAYMLTADRGRCSVDTVVNVGVLDLTSLNVGPPDTILCAGDPLTLDATVPGMVQYTWSPSNLNRPIFDVVVSDEYQVTVTAAGCEVMDTILVNFDQPAIFDLHVIPNAVDTTICAGDALSYDFMIPNADFLWQDDNQMDIDQDGSIELVDAGQYTLSVTTGTCTTIDTINISIQDIPALALQDTLKSCEGDTETIIATAGSATYLWSTNETNDMIDVTTDGLYNVTVTENGCPATDSTFVVFNPIPVYRLPTDEAICDGDSVLLDISAIAAASFELLGPNGDIDDMADTFVKTAGEYTLSLTSGDNCMARDTFDLMLNPTPFFDLPDSTGLCDGMMVTLAPTFANMPDRFRWFNADGNPTLNVSTTGEVYLDAFITTNNQECLWSDTTFILVAPIPSVDLGADAQICSDSTLILDATTSGASYSWDSGETTPTIDVSLAGTYSVTVDVKGCTDTDDLEVMTIQAPDVDLGVDTTICSGDMLTLNTGNAAWTTTWSTSETASMIDVAGGETYAVTVEDNGCFDTDEITIDTSAIPVFDLGDDIEICDQVGVELNVNIPDVSVIWNTTETGNMIRVTDLGIYEATATSMDGCTFTDDIVLSERTCVRFDIYRPNVFSPHSTIAGNGLFSVQPTPSAIITAYEINIFNRWGNLMFTSNDPNEGWDGTARNFNTQLASPGVYVYTITVTYTDDFETNRTDVFKGDVTLID